MTSVAGSLGGGRLVILQPAFEAGDGIEVALGLARWWSAQLKGAGLETFWFMLGVPDTADPRRLLVFDGWPERQIAEALVAGLQARFGLVPEFRARGTRAEISGRLFEVTSEGVVQAIDSWQFDGDNLQIPAFAQDVVDGVTRRLGKSPASVSWQDAFGTGDDFASVCHLAALGAVSLLEDGFARGPEVAIKALTATYRAAPLMQPAIDLLPDLLRAMARQCGATEMQLAAVVKQARDALGRSPREWDGVVARALTGPE